MMLTRDSGDFQRAVRLLQGVSDLNSNLQRLLERYCTFREPIPQRLACEILHHQEIGTVVTPDVVEGADMGGA
jgi:hypothetical protein